MILGDRVDRMELGEVTSELLALRKLYGLLQESEDGKPDGLPVHVCAVL